MTPAKVVFVGGGHTHVLALQRLAKTWPAGVKPVLITAHWQTPYSGMLPGYVAGVYRRDECFINLRRVAEKFGATLIESPAVHLDADACLLTLADGQKLSYDILSINLGGNVSPPFGGEGMCPVKPIDGFMRWLEWLDKEAIQNVVVVGGGAGGVEVALAIDARRKSGGNHLPPMRIQLVGNVLLADYPAALSDRLRVAMIRRGINIVEDARAVARQSAALLLDDGRQLPADKVIFATPVGAPHWLADSALTLSDKGFVCVDPCLRSVSHPKVFACGDCAEHVAGRQAKSGVLAVRQAPSLADNILALLQGRAPCPWPAPMTTLSIIGAGDGSAVAAYGRFVVGGKWVWHWKNHLDKKFMRRFC